LLPHLLSYSQRFIKCCNLFLMTYLDKLFLSTLGVTLFISHTAHAQLGVNLGGDTPQTALDVNGAITTRPVSVAVASNAAAVPANAGQVVLTGSATADIMLTTSVTPFAGQLLTVVNNTAGGQRALFNGIPIANGQALFFTGDAASGSFKSVDNGGAASATTTYWNLKGNAGTSPASNFLGTTDGQDQAFRTSNTERLRILAGGNVGVGTTTPRSTLEVNGSVAGNYRNIATAGLTSLSNSDFVVVYTGTSAGTFVLPSGLSTKGRLYTIKNATNSRTLTLNTTGSETIAGSASLSIPAGQSVQVVSTGVTSGTATYEIANFSSATSAPTLASASNGLTATGGNVQLGGSLTATTDVATAGHDLTFSGAGKFAFGTATTSGLFNVSGAMGSNSFTSGLNLTNTSGLSTGNTLSITPGYPGANSGITTGTMATYDLPGSGNHIFGDHVIPDGNLNNLGNPDNRWANVYGINGNFAGSLTANASAPATSITASATDYFVVTQSPITYRLPAVESSAGRTLIIYAFGGDATIRVVNGTIYGPSAFTVNSVTSYTLPQYHRITFICDGSNWISTAYL
jgi:hypothetical protein